MAALALPQIQFLPNVGGLLSTLFQVTGLQSVGNLLSQVQQMVSKKELLDPTEVKTLVSDLDAFLGTLGALDPKGGFAQIKAEIDKYGAVVAAIVSGQDQVVTDLFEVLPNGERIELELLIRIKNAPVVLPAAG